MYFHNSRSRPGGGAVGSTLGVLLCSNKNRPLQGDLCYKLYTEVANLLRRAYFFRFGAAFFFAGAFFAAFFATFLTAFFATFFTTFFTTFLAGAFLTVFLTAFFATFFFAAINFFVVRIVYE